MMILMVVRMMVVEWRGSKKKVVISLQPLSVYLPTPIVVKKATF